MKIKQLMICVALTLNLCVFANWAVTGVQDRSRGVITSGIRIVRAQESGIVQRVWWTETLLKAGDVFEKHDSGDEYFLVRTRKGTFVELYVSKTNELFVAAASEAETAESPFLGGNLEGPSMRELPGNVTSYKGSEAKRIVQGSGDVQSEMIVVKYADIELLALFELRVRGVTIETNLTRDWRAFESDRENFYNIPKDAKRSILLQSELRKRVHLIKRGG